MVYLIPQTFDVKRPFTAFGVSYTPGMQVPGEILVHLRSADTLLSRRFVVPTPDPHQRDTKPEHPTPTAMPATVRQQIASGPKQSGTIAVTYDTDPGDELRVVFDASFPGPSAWDFGDGGGSVQGDAHTTRTYSAPGTYQVTCTSYTHEGTVSVTVPQVAGETAGASKTRGTRRSTKE